MARSRRSSSRTSATSPTSRSSRCWSSPGDSVAPEDPLVTLESDKATMDVPAPFAGDGGRAAGRRRRHGLRGLADAHAARSEGDGAQPPSRLLPRTDDGRRERSRGIAGAIRAEEQADGAGAAHAPALRRRLRPADGRAGRCRPTPARRCAALARELGVDLARRRGHPAARAGSPRRTSRRASKAPAAAPAKAPAAAGAAIEGLPRAVAAGRLREVRAGRAPPAARASRRSRGRTWPATG